METNITQYVLSRDRFDGVIFDLDGVVTQTADIHAIAWKRLFNRYLEQRGTREGKSYQPFDEYSDYREYVDGKPRYDGVESFLSSKGIDLPYGSPDDSPEAETICGLGNKKNNIFQDLLESRGVSVFPSTIALVKALRVKDFKTAIISSSKNCEDILRTANIRDLFDVKVDGVDSERLNLNGKPAPDIFLEAARQLGISPQRAVVVEDALAGVRAGKDGEFGLVIGVDRDNMKDAFSKSGADWIVKGLSEVTVEKDDMRPKEGDTSTLPSALACWTEIVEQAKDRKWMIFLDYDGTLTPIVSRPEDAVLTDEMRDTLLALSKKYRVAIISGRELKNVRELVGINTILYAGSHGFEISSPGLAYRHGEEFIPVLDDAEDRLHKALVDIQGFRVERKPFSIAVHYRQAEDRDIKRIEARIDEVLEDFSNLRKSGGKKIFEVKPNIDWHKGKAILWVLDRLEVNRSDVFLLYIGDDVTDEDAFKILKKDGVGILVRDKESSRTTSADYILDSTDEVKQLLARLVSEK